MNLDLVPCLFLYIKKEAVPRLLLRYQTLLRLAPFPYTISFSHISFFSSFPSLSLKTLITPSFTLLSLFIQAVPKSLSSQFSLWLSADQPSLASTFPHFSFPALLFPLSFIVYWYTYTYSFIYTFMWMRWDHFGAIGVNVSLCGVCMDHVWTIWTSWTTCTTVLWKDLASCRDIQRTDRQQDKHNHSQKN